MWVMGIGDITPQAACSDYSVGLQNIDHRFYIPRRIKRIGIYVDVVLSSSMSQSAATCPTATMARFGIVGDTGRPKDMCGLVARIVVHPDNLHGIVALQM
jgi:hypothetical protein